MRLTQKICTGISKPFRYIKSEASNLFSCVTKSTREGIKATGKAAGRIIWNKKLENLYTETQNNKYVKIGVSLIWTLLFVWFGYKIYTYFPAKFNTTDSLLLVCYLLAETLILFYFLRDMRRILSWRKRENIREKIDVCEIEALKKFLLSQNLSATQKEILTEKFKCSAKNKEILDIYENIVLYEMDKKTDEIIERYSKIVGIGNLVSPKFSWDYILSLLAFSKMLLEIAKVYRVRLSIRTFASIFIFGLIIISVSAILMQSIQQITNKNQSAIAILGGVGAWIMSKTIELAIPYYTIGAVGYAIQYTLRPIKPCS